MSTIPVEGPAPRWWPAVLDRRPGRALLIVVLLAAGIGAVRYMTERPGLEDGQTEHYWPLVNSLLDGKGYSLCDPLYFPLCAPGDPSAMREPLPTLLFAGVALLTGRSFFLTVGTQLLLNLAVLLMIYGFVRSWLGRRAALLAAIVWALYLPAVKLITQLSGDLAGTFLLIASAWALMTAMRSGRPVHWAFTGALLGLGILSRSALIIIIAPWALACAWQGWRRSRTFVPVLSFIAAIVVVLSPWVIRNHQVFGRFIVGTSMNGYNIWRNNHHLNTDNYLRYIDFLEADTLADELIARRPDLPARLNEAQMDTVYAHEGVRTLKAHPGRYVALSFWRLIPLWTNWGVNQAYHKPIDITDYIVVAQQLILLVLLVLGLRHLGWGHWPLFAAIAVEVAAYTALVAQVRYLMPVMPLVIAFAVAGLLKPRLATGTSE